jgi:hypothetical protein
MFYHALFCKKPIKLNKLVSNAFILKPQKVSENPAVTINNHYFF